MDLTFFCPSERLEHFRSKFVRNRKPLKTSEYETNRDVLSNHGLENSFVYLANEGAKCFKTTGKLLDQIYETSLEYPVEEYRQIYPVLIIEINDKYYVTSKQENCIFAFVFEKSKPQRYTTLCLQIRDKNGLVRDFLGPQNIGTEFERGTMGVLLVINTWLYRRQTNPDAWMFPRQHEKNVRANREYRDIQLIVPKQEIKLYQQHASEVVRPGIGSGIERRPHNRRAHTRKLRDKEGKVLKEVPVRECKIHPNRGDWTQSSVIYTPDSQ